MTTPYDHERELRRRIVRTSLVAWLCFFVLVVCLVVAVDGHRLPAVVVAVPAVVLLVLSLWRVRRLSG
jgi:hypothetical protein